MMPGLLPGADRDLVNYLSMRIKKSFAEVMTNSKVLEMKEVKDGISVKIQDDKGNTTDKVYDYVLMSIGRKPETKGLGLKNTKVTITDRGWIKVNKQLQTTHPNIFAIGDIAGEPMLAHKASTKAGLQLNLLQDIKLLLNRSQFLLLFLLILKLPGQALQKSKQRRMEQNTKLQNFPGQQRQSSYLDGVTNNC